jgi:hypothetical protein
MPESKDIPPLPDLPSAEYVFVDEFVRLHGTTQHLRRQIDRLAEVDIHRSGPNGWLAYVCDNSARIAGAIARVQTANATAFTAMARLKKVAN